MLPAGPLGSVQPFVSGALLALGAVFLVVNARLLAEYLRYLRRRRRALVVWPGATPRHGGVGLAIAAVLGLLVWYKLFVVGAHAFGEGMMFLYYGCLAPLGRRIRRGLYEDGVWADAAFVPYGEIGGVRWREAPDAITLSVSSRTRSRAWRLVVPSRHYAAARRILEGRIGEQPILFAGTGPDPGGDTAAAEADGDDRARKSSSASSR